MKNKTAFSLLELAVVTIIIGLISAGLVKSVSIIRSSRLNMARSLTIESKIGQMDGLIAWYETSMIESVKKSEAYDGAMISSWYDISPASIPEQKNTLTKTAGSDFVYESDGINSLPSMKTSSNGKISLLYFYQGPSNVATLFIVFRPTVAPSGLIKYVLDSSTASNTLIGITNNAVYLDYGSGKITSNTTNSASFSINNNYILSASMAHSLSKVFVNDATNIIGAIALDAGSNQWIGLTVGSDKSGTKTLDALISEVIVFNRVLSTNERKAVMAYLGKKYKIAVSGL